LVKTNGRFDDQDRFFVDLEMEFIVKKYEPLLISNGGNYEQTALNVRAFQFWNCLAFLDTTTNTWRCAVRKLVDVRKENIENWLPGQGSANDAK
jgi:predicted PolB exonuclease-like 3'-5' exonuclease